MPSRTDSFGIVYLEAWLNGVPVIGARAGGVPEVITDGVDGYLVDFGDVAALANRIELLLRRPEAARAMGEAGRRKVLGRAHVGSQDRPHSRDLSPQHRGDE